MAEREGVRKTGEAIVVSSTPDVCLTPLGPSMVPVPYTIIARFDAGAGEVTTVRMTGLPTMTMMSRITTVVGDEAGTGGGVESGVNRGCCRPITHSTTVRAGKQYVLYHGTEMWMNCTSPDGTGNTRGTVNYVRSAGGGAGGGGGGGWNDDSQDASPRPLEPETPAEDAASREGLGFWGQVKGVGKGVWSAGKETVQGVAGIGKGAWNLTGGWLSNPAAAEQTWTHLKGTAQAVWDHPSTVWDAVKEPYQAAWRAGRYGEAIGRGIVDGVLLVGTDGIGDLFEGAEVVGDIGKVEAKLGELSETEAKLGKLTDIEGRLAEAEPGIAAEAKDGVKITRGPLAVELPPDRAAHVLNGEFSAKGKFKSGLHKLDAARQMDHDGRLVLVEEQVSANGVVQGSVNGQFKTFFPEGWSDETILSAGQSVAGSAVPSAEGAFEGVYEGVTVRGYLDPTTGQIQTFYPKWPQ